MGILVLCVDRDDDLGRKANIKGPMIGRDECLKAATGLAVADPSDTDSNTIFEAIKTFDSLKKEKKDVEVALITGAVPTGIKSDEELSRQLEIVLEKYPTDRAILVTDGADDEQIIPVIQSYIKIASIRRLVVKQAERLESVYYKLSDFIKRVLHDRELARLLLGVPGIAALIFALFGAEGSRIIAGFIGLYLIIKGLNLEVHIDYFFGEMKSSMRESQLSFFLYVISVIIFVVGTFQSIISVPESPDLLIKTLSFAKTAIYLYLAAFLTYIVGKAVRVYPNTIKIIDYITIALSFITASFIIQNTIESYLTRNFIITDVYSFGIVGFILIMILIIIKKFFIQKRFKSIIEETVDES